MNINLYIEALCTALFLWGCGYGVYMKCNRGIAKNARGQQLRRYLSAAIIAALPMAIAQTTLFQPIMLMNLFVSSAWLVTYPLLYHLTNRKVSPDYDNRLDIAMGIYLYGWLSCLSAIFPNMGFIIGIIDFALLMFPIFQWVYYFACKGCIDADGMKMLQETHYNEIIEFLRSYHPLKVLFVAFSIIVMLVFCIWVNEFQPLQIQELNIYQLLLLISVVLFITIYLWKPNHGIFVRTGVAVLYNVVKEYVANNNRYVQELQQRVDALNVTPLNEPQKKSTIMMVIGESASRDFMSAFNDVDVNTTPWMTQMMQDKEHFIVFPNAYSCGVQTVPVLEKALTEYNQYTGGEFYTSMSIVDIARKLGYKIHWYSNQGHLGAADTPITLVANTSDVAKWTKQELNKVQYDENLIDFLDEVNPEENNLVVLHLKGSHFNFENRFPASHRQWGKAGDDDNIVNYKNSIHYTDSVLNRFYDYGRKKLNLQAMVYFSDHGCVPDRHRLPNFGGFGDTRIPLCVWLNDDYCNRHPMRAEALRKNRNCYWTNDLAYELMCGIFDVKSNHFKEFNSLASTDYHYTKEELVAMDGKIKIKDDNWNSSKEQK
ncbi:MAG: phosphoethanolamine transferase [Bacteroidaceae bacterium]|nr:phosphoethanolamine transferase [Bacteroidaceae bacterium]